MIKYTIYTENKTNLVEILQGNVTNYTIYPAMGTWRGFAQETAAITILSEPNIDETVRRIAKAIKFANNQAHVLIERSIVDTMEVV